MTKTGAWAGRVLAGLLSLPAAAQEAVPETAPAGDPAAGADVAAGMPDLDGPAAAAALLEVLAGAAPGRPELPVIGPADADGTKWIRALVPHPDWPVLVPFALRVGFACAPGAAAGGVEVSDPACWQVLEPPPDDAAPAAGEGS